MNGALILGIDQAKHSGVAFVAPRGEVIQLGVASTWRARAEVLADGQRHAERYGVPLIAVLEDHSEVPASAGRNTVTVLGLGEARGRWKEGLERARIAYEAVSPRVWRGAVLGPGANRLCRRDVKRAAIRWAEALLRQRGPVAGRLNADSAEALALAWWGLHAPQVGAIARRLAG